MNPSLKKFTRKHQIILLSSAVLILAFLITPLVVKASSSKPARTMQVKSIEIKDGDSLWSIAKEYYTEEYSSIPSYVDAIKNCNCLQSDEIHTGNYIIIPFYS